MVDIRDVLFRLAYPLYHLRGVVAYLSDKLVEKGLCVLLPFEVPRRRVRLIKGLELLRGCCLLTLDDE
jgi:hypothetical protein